MKHLKLIVNNKNIKRDIFFKKNELKLILNLYAEMVSGGEWKDYGLSISKKEVSFNVYHGASEFPTYRIAKNLKPKNKSEKYLVKDAKSKIIDNSEDLQNLIYDIAKENQVQPKDFFRILYQIILSTNRGPKIGPFIEDVGMKEVAEKIKRNL